MPSLAIAAFNSASRAAFPCKTSCRRCVCVAAHSFSLATDAVPLAAGLASVIEPSRHEDTLPCTSATP